MGKSLFGIVTQATGLSDTGSTFGKTEHAFRTLLLNPKPETLSLTLQDGSTAALPGNDYRHPFWSEAARISRDERRPMLVEIDDAGQTVTFALSTLADIVAIYPPEGRRTDIAFSESHAVYWLQDTSRQMLETAKVAFADGASVYYCVDGETGEIIAMQRAQHAAGYTSPGLAPKPHEPGDELEVQRDVKGLDANPITPQDAANLFQWAISDPSSEFIPWVYKFDCCMARAAQMRRIFQKHGFDCRKSYVQAHMSKDPSNTHGESRLVLKSDPRVKWTYHIAPAVSVRTARGAVTWYVIDPSISKAATTFAEWLSLLDDDTYNHMPEFSSIRPSNTYSPTTPWAHTADAAPWIYEGADVLDQVRKRFSEHWIKYFGGHIA